jgi:predicted porin
MQALKKAIPAALVLAFAGAAQAQVSVYGLIDMSYGKNEFIGDEKAGLHSGGDDGSSQGNSTTRFGIKGSTDVGSGMKVNFKMESAGITSNGEVGTTSTSTNTFDVNDLGTPATRIGTVDVDSNSGQPFFNRQMWLGLSGGFGEVRVGRQDSVPFQVMGNFDFNGQSNGVTSGYSGVAVWGTGRQSRSIQYISPAMSGVTVHLGYVPEDTDKTNTDKATASGAVLYTAGALQLGASFEGKRVEKGRDFFSLAGSYDFKAVKVMAGYMSMSEDERGATPTEKITGPVLGVVAPVAGFSVGAHYAKDTKNSKDAVVELFVNKEVFKNTYGYAEFGKMSSDAAAKDGDQSFSVGVIYVF